MKEPTPRQEVYDIYWRFAAERHAIFERRLRGEGRPWTSDPILLKFKFCNTFRAVDRVSQWGIENVCYRGRTKGHGYNPVSDDSMWRTSDEDLLLGIVLYRLFNRSETFGGLNSIPTNPVCVDSLKNGGLLRGLEEVRKRDNKLYGNAFILCANNAYGVPSKHENHVELLKDMFVKNNLTGDIVDSESLEEVYNILHGYPLIGDFMAYQIAIDINYSELVNFSENDFTMPGPGALRGLKKVFHDLGDFTPQETILWMVERQDQEFERLGLEFNGLFGRPIHAIDAQGLFCETDKYCREAHPELASERVKIKAKYSQNPDPYPLFFPPKWGLEYRGKVHGSTNHARVEEWL